MIEYRNKLAKEWNLNLIVGQNKKALADKLTYPDGNVDRLTCCKNLKSEALKKTLSGEWPKYKLDHSTGEFIIDPEIVSYTGVIVGIRADEEGSRSKERYFSPRDKNNYLSIGCAPCTRQVAEGGDIRSGRWWWENPETKECGLHFKQ